MSFGSLGFMGVYKRHPGGGGEGGRGGGMYIEVLMFGLCTMLPVRFVGVSTIDRAAVTRRSP